MELAINSPSKIKKVGVTCRMGQFKLLDAIIGSEPDKPLPGTLFLWGPQAAGKCFTLTKVLEGKKNIHVIKMHCAEILCGRRAFFETFLKQLLSYDNRPLGPNFKCESLHKLYGSIYDFMHDQGLMNRDLRVIAIIQGAEALKGEDEDILCFFSSLKDIIRANICIALVSKLPPTHFMPNLMEHSFIPIHFPQYSSDELIEILKEEKIGRRRSQKSGSYYDFYVKMMINIFYPVCRDVRKLMRLARSHWDSFQSSVEESSDFNPSKMWKTLEPQMRAQFFDLNSTTIISDLKNDIEQNRNQENLGKGLNLPDNAKYVLIAAYLATHNPPYSDKRFFVKSKQGKAKKPRMASNANLKTDSNSSSKPFVRSFELNRLTAIFSAIQEYCNDQAVNRNRNINLMALLTTLCQNKLIQCLGEDSFGNMKYKCLLDYDAVLDISRSVHFQINNFLFRLL